MKSQFLLIGLIFCNLIDAMEQENHDIVVETFSVEDGGHKVVSNKKMWLKRSMAGALYVLLLVSSGAGIATTIQSIHVTKSVTVGPYKTTPKNTSTCHYSAVYNCTSDDTGNKRGFNPSDYSGAESLNYSNFESFNYSDFEFLNKSYNCTDLKGADRSYFVKDCSSVSASPQLIPGIITIVTSILGVSLQGLFDLMHYTKYV